MLILVAVTVNLANENGGLFVKTREAKQDTAYKSEEENLLMYIYGEGVYDATTGKVNLTKLEERLNNSGEWGTTAIVGTELTVVGKQSGEIHKINEDGIITKKNIPSEVTITEENYGDKVAYSAGEVDDWKIFYKDDSYVYIITSDYLNNENLPTGLNMSKHGENGAYWASEDNFTSTGASNITAEVANKYNLSWLNSNTSSINPNARATADLLNVSAWTAKFGNASKGIEAIGGPTLEMWVKSWNAKSTLQLKTEYDSTGYYIGPTTTTESLSEINDEEDSAKGGKEVELSSDTNLYSEGSLYFPYISIHNGCFGYWLASPSGGGANYITIVGAAGDGGYIGDPGGNAYSDYVNSVRPLVSIPSSLIGEKDESGAWTVNLD